MKRIVGIVTLCFVAIATAENAIELTSNDIQQLDNAFASVDSKALNIEDIISDAVFDVIVGAIEKIEPISLPTISRSYTLGLLTGTFALENNEVTGFSTMELDEENIEMDTEMSGLTVTFTINMPVTIGELTVSSDYVASMNKLALTGGIETTYYNLESTMVITGSYNILTPTKYKFCIVSADISASSVSTRFTGHKYSDFIVNKLAEVAYKYLAAPMLATVSYIFQGFVTALFGTLC